MQPLKRTRRNTSDESSDESDLPLQKSARIHQLPSPPAALPIVPQEPPAPPAPTVAPVPPPPVLYTLPAKVKGRVYVPRVPYQLFETAEASNESCLEPPPVFGLDGRATHLYFEIASWGVMWAGMNKKTREEHEAAILMMIEKTGKTQEQIENMGTACCGITLQQCDYWYSLACLYGRRINVATAGKDAGRGSGFSSRCRGCLANHNALNLRLCCTFVETALRKMAFNLIIHDEWSGKVSQDVSYSLVLRVLRNGGFIHLRTQADVIAIRKPLTKDKQAEHLTWIKARPHHGFRTGAELILLTEAGLNMISLDRSDSNKKIDQIGQTIVADSWGFNRLSNSLSERATDRLLHEILAGDYAEGDAAFRQRNGDVEPRRLSEAWEASIQRKWASMSSEAKTQQYKSRREGPVDPNFVFPDIRFWGPDGGLPEFQRLCRLNANESGNLVDEMSGMELTCDNWGVDRVDGRKVFASVETLTLEMQRRYMVQADFRIATQLILREYLNQIRAFRNSQAYRDNMDNDFFTWMRYHHTKTDAELKTAISRFPDKCLKTLMASSKKRKLDSDDETDDK
ncbi:hypothetical protein HK100_002318 [Physocladia obscura]|uniref:Uncharacterized protein n=1 Tax=Physocladia obscura TaxID=109957 RepID=A0AAD5SVY2_9FUNG|nr:hypothetical protein HK100_002318 [Physocladia obscura]